TSENKGKCLHLHVARSDEQRNLRVTKRHDNRGNRPHVKTPETPETDLKTAWNHQLKRDSCSHHSKQKEQVPRVGAQKKGLGELCARVSCILPKPYPNIHLLRDPSQEKGNQLLADNSSTTRSRYLVFGLKRTVRDIWKPATLPNTTRSKALRKAAAHHNKPPTDTNHQHSTELTANANVALRDQLLRDHYNTVDQHYRPP
ncbi:hypothetical protein ACJJTC_002210, partial [Scirpophaga incertulas]